MYGWHTHIELTLSFDMSLFILRTFFNLKYTLYDINIPLYLSLTRIGRFPFN